MWMVEIKHMEMCTPVFWRFRRDDDAVTPLVVTVCW